MNRLHIIFIPGLGDHKAYGQDKAVRLWRLYGVRPQYHAVGWATGSWDEKERKLLTEIDQYLAKGDRVGLVGFSAGASAAFNVFMARSDKLAGAVLISGKIRGSGNLSAGRRANNAFVESLDQAAQSVTGLSAGQKTRLLTIYPKHDPVVSYADASLPGVVMRRSPATSHQLSVAYSLTVGAFTIIRFLRRAGKSLT